VFFSHANCSSPLGDRYNGTGLPLGDGRSAAEAKADRGAGPLGRNGVRVGGVLYVPPPARPTRERATLTGVVSRAGSGAHSPFLPGGPAPSKVLLGQPWPPSAAPGLAGRSERGHRGAKFPVHGDTRGARTLKGLSPAVADDVGGAAGTDNEGCAGRVVSHHVLQGILKALSTNAHLFNLLWRTATCSCCRKRAAYEV